jgi:NAD+ diphosphatase
MKPFTTLKVPETLGFASATMDRVAAKRNDPAFIAEAFAAPDARFLILKEDVPVLSAPSDGTALFERSMLPPDLRSSEMIFLGRHGAGGQPVFVHVEATGSENPEQAMVETRTLIDLRSIAQQGLVPHDEVGLLACAKALSTWHRTHGFCSRCGARSRLADGGWKRVCESCSAEHFPRTDPVVIMVATHDDRVLLGRQPRFPPGMYSALAGFMEPGETIEAAVRREIYEEAGIRCGAVRYLGSQPWPFPMQLMIGAETEALHDTIDIDRDELEDARWFTRDEIKAMFRDEHPQGLKAPHPVAIAHHLLRAWFRG